MEPVVIGQHSHLSQNGEVGSCHLSLCGVTPRVNKLVFGRDFIELHHEVFLVYAL